MSWGRLEYHYKIRSEYETVTKWAYKVVLNDSGVYDFHYMDNIIYSISADKVKEIDILRSQFKKI